MSMPIPLSPALLALFHRRWALPILARLHHAEGVSGWAGGAKFVTLCHALDANQAAVRQSLDHLIDLRYVARNTGHGHPLRPEYVLTRRGERIAPTCAAVDTALETLDARSLGLRRWSMPVLHAIDRLEPARFTAIAETLGAVTDRALAMALRGLCERSLVGREAAESPPVAACYRVEPAAAALTPLLARLRE